MKIIIIVLLLFFSIAVCNATNPNSAKDPSWRPTIVPFYAEENANTNTQISVQNYAKCSGQPVCVAKVVYVIDGDTVILSTGEKVRYIGIDTPETHHPFKKVECFGKEASIENKKLVEGKEARLEKDVSDKDLYGRLLRYVYLPALNQNGTGPAGEAGVSGDFVNDSLVRNGYASASTWPPDVKFSSQFLDAEREARQSERGLWAPGVCEDKKMEIWDKKIKAKINLEKRYYPKNHQGFRESLVRDILDLTGAPEDRIGFWVYSMLRDIGI